MQVAKRLGEERPFSGAFGVFYHFSVIFRAFCLVTKRNFVYLHSVKGVEAICSLCCLNVNNLKRLRNTLKLNLLRCVLRKTGFVRVKRK